MKIPRIIFILFTIFMITNAFGEEIRIAGGTKFNIDKKKWLIADAKFVLPNHEAIFYLKENQNIKILLAFREVKDIFKCSELKILKKRNVTIKSSSFNNGCLVEYDYKKKKSLQFIINYQNKNKKSFQGFFNATLKKSEYKNMSTKIRQFYANL